ncbi:MAG: site-specific integrase [Desulfobacterales bacterium]|nr:site-specific integrase [Desulfobacterales bacterium]
MGVKIREKLKGSGLYWVFINHNGIRKSKKIGNDKKVALEVAEKIKAKLVLNELRVEKINKKCPTFKEYAEMWLSLPNDRKESTQANYEQFLKNHIYPHIGKMRLDQLCRKDFKLLFDKISSNGVSLSSCKSIKIPINGILGHAVDSELIDVNHLKNIKFGKTKLKYNINPLTENEALILLSKALEYNDGFYYPAILCLLRTGLRIGELQALTWADIDFENRLIDINKTWWRGVISTTKNKKTRKVDMSKQLAKTLRDLKQRQWKKYAGEDVPPWVFASKYGRVLCLHLFRKALNEYLEAAGLRHIRIHDLRHSYATIRLLKGHNIGDVSYQLGHADISTTFTIYTHWIPGKFKSEVDELDMHPNAPQAHPEGKEIAMK